MPSGVVGSEIESINPLVTSCHSPYMLRKQGETISPAGVLEYVVIDFGAMGYRGVDGLCR